MIHVGDIKLGWKEKKAVNDILDSGRFTEGKKTREFEKAWSRYVGTRYAVAVNSGTSALIAGLLALNNKNNNNDDGVVVGKRFNVITTPLTYIATSNAIWLSGCKPVYVDVDPNTLVIRPDNIKAVLEQASDVDSYVGVLPVHLMGFPCDMNEINKIAKKYNLFVLEDAAEAHGTIYNGNKVGSLSDLSIFSFFIAHNIQAGELGMVNTDDYEIVEFVRQIKNHGSSCVCSKCTRNTVGCPNFNKYLIDPRFTHTLIGYNFKTMDFQSAIALCQLEKADWIKKRRNSNVKYLNEGLEKVDGLSLPVYSKDVSYFAYPLVHKNARNICKKLEKRGIETRSLFGCIPTMQPSFGFLKYEYEDKLSVAKYLGLYGFFVGCHQYLTRSDLDFMIKTIRGIVK